MNDAAPSRTRWPDAWLLDCLPPSRGAAVRRAEADTGAGSAWEALARAGVPEGETADAAAAACGTARASREQLMAAAPGLVPLHLAERFRVVPLGMERGVLAVAASDPRSPDVAEHLGFVLGCRVRPVVAAPSEVDAALRRLREAADGQARADAAIPRVTAPGTGAAALHESLVREAVEMGASDVHLEPEQGGGLLVRFRVDGALHDHARIAPEAAPALVSRIKVMAGLDIADRIRPQDGRASARVGGRGVDLRISTLPLGERGEKVVVRVLDGRGTGVGLDGLGFLPGELHTLERLLGQREGLVLVTGPTGSGKTTTLYSALRHAQSSEANVVTVEDPIEYRLEGVNQVQVNEKAGLTFATALRSILRQDPDVILVGEIRDAETASVALKASMTGHLVLSTLHTNDAPSAIGRMLDIGVEPAALSDALKGVVAQRLVRRLCPDCSRPVPLSELPADQQQLLAGRATAGLRAAVGCAACRGTGYRGRTVVAEVLAVTPEVARTIVAGASAAEIARAGAQAGMRSLWEAGLERVLVGHTSLHELIDNIPAPLEQTAAATQSDVDALLASMLGGGFGGAAAPAAAAPAASPPPVVVPIARGRAVSRPGMGGPRVLLVDDDREARRALRSVLEMEGFRVLEAADGEAGAAYAARMRPDAVVTEAVLPRLDGFGLLQAVALGADAPPVLVLTTQTDEAFAEWALELGACEVLEKGVEPRFVAARIRAALGQEAEERVAGD